MWKSSMTEAQCDNRISMVAMWFLNWTLNDLKQSIPVANGQEILQIFPIWLKSGCHFLGLKQNSCIKYVCLCVFGFYIQTYPNPKTIWQPVKSFCPTSPKSWTISFTKRSAAARPLSEVLDPASTEKISKRSCVSTWPTFAQSGGRCPNLHVFQGSKGSDVLWACVGKFAWSFLSQKRKTTPKSQKHLVDLKTQGIGLGRWIPSQNKIPYNPKKLTYIVHFGSKSLSADPVRRAQSSFLM